MNFTVALNILSFSISFTYNSYVSVLGLAGRPRFFGDRLCLGDIDVRPAIGDSEAEGPADVNLRPDERSDEFHSVRVFDAADSAHLV